MSWSLGTPVPQKWIKNSPMVTILPVRHLIFYFRNFGSEFASLDAERYSFFTLGIIRLSDRTPLPYPLVTRIMKYPVFVLWDSSRHSNRTTYLHNSFIQSRNVSIFAVICAEMEKKSLFFTKYPFAYPVIQ